MAWTYRAQLKQVTEPVLRIAQLEAQAAASGDRTLFMALQDPDDPTWLEAQSRRFGRLERVGLPEIGWEASGVPKLGNVSLEPGGARLDVTYYFSVTQPLSGTPASVALRVPQFYKPLPGGWVHAMPGRDFWGRLREWHGKRVLATYFQRDADAIEPLIQHLDSLLDHTCASLSCPTQVMVSIDTSPETLTRLAYLAYGYDGESLALRYPSPHLLGLPVDAPSRDELRRALERHVIQTLLYRASEERLVMDYEAVQELVRWELTQAGLADSFITPEITRSLAATLQTGAWQPLETIPLQLRASDLPSTTQLVMPLALAFVEEQFGPGSVSSLVPAMGTNLMLGGAIRETFGQDPATLRVPWWKYLRQQAGMPVLDSIPPDGELTLGCTSNLTEVIYSVWSIRTDGTQADQIEQDAVFPIWSNDGKRYAYIHVQDDQSSSSSTPEQAVISPEIGWLPDGRLWGVGDGWVTGPDGIARKDKMSLIDVDTGQVIPLDGTGHVWSPDGTRVAYFDTYSLDLWLADADGSNARRVAPTWTTSALASYPPDWIAPSDQLLAWSPDSQQLAFASSVVLTSTDLSPRPLNNEIRVVDVVSGSQQVLVYLARLSTALAPVTENSTEQTALRMGVRRMAMSGLSWSPDGSRLALTMSWQGWASIILVDAGSGAALAQMEGDWNRIALSYQQPWSPDGRFLVVDVMPNAASVEIYPSDGRSLKTAALLAPQSMLIVWDTQTGRRSAVPGSGWTWAPDGTWLAVLQPSGLLLVTPDMLASHWLDMPTCTHVAWRPQR